MEISKDLIAASAIPLVLTILAGGDDYGYSIIKKVKDVSNEEITWKEGSLYPVLAKLELNGHLTSYQKVEGGRKRKYYRINSSGESYLETLKNEWNFLTQTMQTLWKAPKMTI